MKHLTVLALLSLLLGEQSFGQARPQGHVPRRTSRPLRLRKLLGQRL
jgi:hypothetical protein